MADATARKLKKLTPTREKRVTEEGLEGLKKS